MLKKFVILMTAIGVLFCLHGLVLAAAIQPASFYVLDGDDGSVDLEISNWPFGAGSDYTLYYSLDATQWTPVANRQPTLITIASEPYKPQKVYFSLNNRPVGDPGRPDFAATSYLSPTTDEINGMPVMQSINFVWDVPTTAFDFSLAEVGNVNDGITTLPVPASVLLLGAGLFSFVGLRKSRITK